MNRPELARQLAGRTGPGAAQADAAVKAVPASKAVRFRAADALRAAINGAPGPGSRP